jgi:3-deoxy-D-manno-octulosonic-acid transferase
MLRNADLLCAQTRVDAQRLRNLGAPEQLLHVTGNLKFDVELPIRLLEEARELRGHWGRERPVWIAASTHGGEERKVLEAFARLRAIYPDLLLVLVPRHPERFHAAARLCRRRGYTVALRSRTPGPLPLGTQILVGDTMGELQRLYAAADVAFIGGSLVPHGGQNPLEACAVSVPVVFGPHMFHFEEISAMALERGAARQVHDIAGLVAAVTLYFEQPDLRKAAGRAAYTLVTENRGALARTLGTSSTRCARPGGTARRLEREPTSSRLCRHLSALAQHGQRIRALGNASRRRICYRACASRPLALPRRQPRRKPRGNVR